MSDQMQALIDAVQDNAAATNRLADMIAAYILSDRPQLAAKFVAPNLRRPLEAYATFDWDSIGATVTKRDQDGATLVMYQGREYKRYRSTEDDSKGIDIRFRCVIAGNVDDQNLVWATLIKFGGKPKTDSKPLRGELAERVRSAASAPAAATQALPPPTPSVFVANSEQRKAVTFLLAYAIKWLASPGKGMPAQDVHSEADVIREKFSVARVMAKQRGITFPEPTNLLEGLRVMKHICDEAIQYDKEHPEVPAK